MSVEYSMPPPAAWTLASWGHYPVNVSSVARASHAFTARIAVFVVVTACLVPWPAFGIWIAPRRPLTESEKLSLAVSESDGICVADVIGSGDTLSEPGFHYLTLMPSTWLKGTYPLRAFNAYEVDMEESMGYEKARNTLRWAGPTGVFFLRRHGPEGGAMSWFLNTTPYYYKDGLVLGTREDVERARTAAANEVELEGVDGMIRDADAIVRGRADSTSARCTVVGVGWTSCMGISVAAVLAGKVEKRHLTAFTPLPVDLEGRDCVFFLEAVADSIWEPLRTKAGILEVAGDSIPRLGISIQALEHKVLAAGSSRAKATRGK